MKKAIVWITPDYFYDVDWPIIKNLKHYYDIKWYVIWGAGSLRNKPSNDDIYKFVQLNYRYRDLRIIRQYWGIIKEIKGINPVVVYNAFLGMPFFLPLLFNLFGKKNVVFEGHEIDPYVSASHDRLSVAYARYNLKNVGHVQVFSKHAEMEFHRLYPGRNCTYVPMVPKDYGKPNRYIEHKNKTAFLFFGGIRSTKRFDVLLDAFLNLDENYSSRAELWVYGNCSGEERGKYLQSILGHNNIKVLFDFVPDELIPDLFTSASYLVQPYQQITQSGPMMIAYNYGLPIIASDIDGFKERIKDGENGFLFKKNDVTDLKRILEFCIDQKEEDYRRIKENAISFAVKEYAPDIVLAKYRDMLDKFIAQNGR